MVRAGSRGILAINLLKNGWKLENYEKVLIMTWYSSWFDTKISEYM
jgi:hypothetical protein